MSWPKSLSRKQAPTQHWLEFKREVALVLCSELWPQMHARHPYRVQWVFDTLSAVRLVDGVVALTLPREIPQALLQPRADPLDDDDDVLSMLHTALLQLHVSLYTRVLPYLLRPSRWGSKRYWASFWRHKKRLHDVRSSAVVIARDVREAFSTYISICRMRRAHQKVLHAREAADPAAVALYAERSKIFAQGDERRQEFWDRRYGDMTAEELLARAASSKKMAGKARHCKQAFNGLKVGAALCKEGASALCGRLSKWRKSRKARDDDPDT